MRELEILGKWLEDKNTDTIWGDSLLDLKENAKTEAMNEIGSMILEIINLTHEQKNEEICK